MKYYTADVGGTEYVIGGAASARRFLRLHPEIRTVWFWWWVRDDLVECREMSYEEMLRTSARKLDRGGTAQWYAARGRL